MNKELLEKYFNNKCSEEELKLVLGWFTNTAHLPEGKAFLYNIWEELDKHESEDKADFDTILSKVHHKINLRQPEISIDKPENGHAIYSRRQHIIGLIRNAAAILLLPVLGLGLFYSVKYYSARYIQKSVNVAFNEVFSSVDAITKVTLPDGSNVWLNHSSSLSYPAVFNGESRNVELKGEGFFEVVHNSAVPFIVNAGELKIVALGTTFNVMAYPEESKIETSLIDGNVEIKMPGKFKASETIYKLKPTDLAIYNKESQEFISKTITDDRYFSWKEGKLIFNGEPLEVVVIKLSRWFNADIQIKDTELNGITLTATFVHETLPQVMELLTLVSPVSYTITDRKADSDGTFSKRKVFLNHSKL